MIALFCVLSAFASEPLWVGLPAERLVGIGLGTPTISEEVPGLQRHPLSTGGLVSLYLSPTVSEAEAVFAHLEQTGATFWAPATEPLPGDRAIGDGTAIVLVRSANVVILVRDPEAHAAVVARRVIGALQPRE